MINKSVPSLKNCQVELHKNQAEILYTNSQIVSCEGGKLGSSHPLVYLNMGEKDFVICPYCSKFFTTNKTKN